MRTIIATLLTIVSLSMVSCSMNDQIEDITLNVENAMSDDNSKQTKSAHNYTDSAYVRIGMYNSIDGYDVRVVDMTIGSSTGAIDIPNFGSNIKNAGNLPTSKEQAVYDQEDGRYNPVVPTYNGCDVIIRFSVILAGKNGVGGKVRMDNITYVISADKTMWEESGMYDYTIGLTPELLGLSAINFDASVEDFQNGADANI